MKKQTIILYLLLTLSIVVTLFLIFRTKGLEQRLKASEADQVMLKEKVGDYQKLMTIDSMLVGGDYNSALKAYNFQLENKLNNDSIGLKLRISLAQSLKKMTANKRLQSDSIRAAELDSLRNEVAAAPQEIRAYDSLSFALEKSKVQLSAARRQLKEKSFGEYLRFESQKGNQIHYVGQVKNKKANGYGIALLDTGSRYEGQWKDNLRHGEGTFYWPDGEYYVGDYSNDKRNGNGTYYWPNKEKYIGQWKDDKRNGEGVFYGSDGEVFTKGMWKDDKLDKATKD